MAKKQEAVQVEQPEVSKNLKQDEFNVKEVLENLQAQYRESIAKAREHEQVSLKALGAIEVLTSMTTNKE